MYRISTIFSVFFLLTQALLPQAHSSEGNGDYMEGVEYRSVTPHQQLESKQIEVIEFFWYKCPYCFYFEPPLNKWLLNKPSNVNFIRIPAIKRPDWKLHAQVYYTAELLGVLKKIHTPLFNAIHEDRRELKTEKSIEDFFSEHGISKNDFREAFNSQHVKQKTEYAEELSRYYQLGGVPTLLVNRKYLTDGSMAEGLKEILDVVDHLISKETKDDATH